MNKQEALKKLEKIEIENSFGHWVGYYGAKELIEQIEPESQLFRSLWRTLSRNAKTETPL